MKRFIFPLVTIVAIIVLYLVNHELGARIVSLSTGSLLELASVIPAVFVLLGLLDVWVPKQVMIKYLGEHSGVMGVMLSFILGSAAAGPLYGAFPVAAVLMKKGARFSNIIIFLGAWSTTKIPMFLFEQASLGLRFALTRLVVDVAVVMIIAFFITRLVSKDEIARIYNQVEKM